LLSEDIMDVEDAASELEAIYRRSQKDLERDDLNTYAANVYTYTNELNRIIAWLQKNLPDSFLDIRAVSFPNLSPNGKTVSPEYGKVLLCRSMTEINLDSERLHKRLTRMPSAASDVSTGKRNATSEPLQLHPKIMEVSGPLFKDKHYSQAVFEAFKAVNSYVKQKSRLTRLDGQKLMAQAFNEVQPVVRLNKGSSQSDRDEQEGFKFLYMGAMCG